MMIIKRHHAPFSEAGAKRLACTRVPAHAAVLRGRIGGASLLYWHRLLLVEAPSSTRAHLHPLRTRGVASIADTGTGTSLQPWHPCP